MKRKLGFATYKNVNEKEKFELLRNTFYAYSVYEINQGLDGAFPTLH